MRRLLFSEATSPRFAAANPIDIISPGRAKNDGAGVGIFRYEGCGTGCVSCDTSRGSTRSSHHEDLLTIRDVSVPITNTIPVWPSDPPVNLTPEDHLSRDKSHTVRVTKIEIGSHTGTHIDAPWHMVEGARRLNEMPIETLIGTAMIFEIPGVTSIARPNVERLNLDAGQVSHDRLAAESPGC